MEYHRYRVLGLRSRYRVLGLRSREEGLAFKVEILNNKIQNTLGKKSCHFASGSRVRRY